MEISKKTDFKDFKIEKLFLSTNNIREDGKHKIEAIEAYIKDTSLVIGPSAADVKEIYWLKLIEFLLDKVPIAQEIDIYKKYLVFTLKESKSIENLESFRDIIKLLEEEIGKNPKDSIKDSIKELEEKYLSKIEVKKILDSIKLKEDGKKEYILETDFKYAGDRGLNEAFIPQSLTVELNIVEESKKHIIKYQDTSKGKVKITLGKDIKIKDKGTIKLILNKGSKNSVYIERTILIKKDAKSDFQWVFSQEDKEKDGE